MEDKDNESQAIKFLETIKPELLQILTEAPPYGSCGIDIFFHNSDIVRIALRAEYSKLRSQEKLKT